MKYVRDLHSIGSDQKFIRVLKKIRNIQIIDYKSLKCTTISMYDKAQFLTYELICNKASNMNETKVTFDCQQGQMQQAASKLIQQTWTTQ